MFKEICLRLSLFLSMQLVSGIVVAQYQKYGIKFYKIEVPAKTDGWYRTGIRLQAFDYVAYEAQGEIELGPIAGKVTASGMIISAPYSIFNYSDDFRHGALLVSNGKAIIETRKAAKNWVTTLGNYFAGNYFVSTDAQELLFRVNDIDYENNRGSFTVFVSIIPLEVHQNRNKYNLCATHSPKKSSAQYKDRFDNVWVTAVQEKFYHGGGADNLYTYKTFRGVSSKVKGCQCTYDFFDNLVDDHYMGTFDFAFTIPDIDQQKYHVLWDVWPHDAFVEFFEKNNQVFNYNPIPNKNMY